MRIFRNRFRKKATQDSERMLFEEGILPLLLAQTAEAKREVIQSNPGLLTETALRLLEKGAAAAGQVSEEKRQWILENRTLLQRCQEIGVEATFAEAPGSQREQEVGLQEILGELAQPARLDEMPRRIELCRRALELVNRKHNPEVWAGLLVVLANSLRQSPCGERSENLEQAIASNKAALEVLTREAMPVVWAEVQINLAITYRERILGERADNLECVIAGYEAALKVRTREVMPMEWAETEMNLATAYCLRMRGERAENLERAIASFEAALEVMAREVMPVECVKAQTNVEKVYARRTLVDLTDSLERAI